MNPNPSCDPPPAVSDQGRSLTLAEVLLLAQIGRQPEGWIEERDLVHAQDGAAAKRGLGHALQLLWACDLVGVFPSPSGAAHRRAVGITDCGVDFLINVRSALALDPARAA